MRVAILGGCRTPFVKAGGVFKSVGPVDLLAAVLSQTVKRLDLDPPLVQEVIAGSVLHNPQIPNIAREAVFKAQLSYATVAHSISNNCITGLVGINCIAEGIASGRISLGLAGGVESMSLPALTFSTAAQKFFLRLAHAKTATAKLSILASWRPKFALPIAPSPKEPSTGMTMGEHCELMVKEFGIARLPQDELAFQSHQRASAAQKDGSLSKDIIQVGTVSLDNLIRPDTSLQKLLALNPVFDRSSTGTLTAGNSSALTDGASIVCLISEQHATSMNRSPLGFIEGVEFAALDPKEGLLMAPTLAVPRLLQRLKLSLADIDIFEIHEAFAGQVLCTLKSWEGGWSRYPDFTKIGRLSTDAINKEGGSIALGHPFAATGGRLVLSALRQLQQTNGRRALLSVCAAGGMGAAVVLSRS